MKSTLITINLILLIFGTFALYAQDLSNIVETDWLQMKEGSSGKTLGAKVESITTPGSDGSTIINLTIPVDNPEQIDAIEVISRETDKPVQQTKKAEWVKDYETEKHELRLFLTRKPGFEFRLRLIDNEKND